MGLRPSHTGPDNENENDNNKSVRPRLVEMLHAEFDQSRACIVIVIVFRSRYRGPCDLAFTLLCDAGENGGKTMHNFLHYF